MAVANMVRNYNEVGDGASNSDVAAELTRQPFLTATNWLELAAFDLVAGVRSSWLLFRSLRCKGAIEFNVQRSHPLHCINIPARPSTNLHNPIRGTSTSGLDRSKDHE